VWLIFQIFKLGIQVEYFLPRKVNYDKAIAIRILVSHCSSIPNINTMG